MRPASKPAGLPAGVPSFLGGVEQLLEETRGKNPSGPAPADTEPLAPLSHTPGASSDSPWLYWSVKRNIRLLPMEDMETCGTRYGS